MKRILLSIILLAIFAAAQAGNSIFSYDGYPVQFYGRDVYSMSMGNTGASDVFRMNNGYANPAMGNDAGYSLFSTGIILGYTQYRSELDGIGEKSYTDNSLDLPYFSLSVPYNRHRFGFQFNSYASGLVKNQISIEDSTFGSLKETQEMDRYLYRADLFYSYKLKNLRMGAGLNYYFGHETRSFIQNSGSGIFDTREQSITSYKNPTITLGTIYNLPRLAMGIHLNLPVSLEGETRRSTIHQIDDTVDASFKLPAMLTGSVTGLLGMNLKLATDFSYETWSAADDSKPDAYSAGLGLAYEPLREEYETGLGRLPYRAGISYRKLPFYDSYGEEIDELGLSAGISLKLMREANRIDIGFQYARRGSLETNKMMDSSYMLIFGLTGFDILSKAPDRKAPREIPAAEDVSGW